MIQCQHCGKQYNTEKKLKCHQARSGSKRCRQQRDILYTCSRCGFNHNHYSELVAHQEHCHNPNPINPDNVLRLFQLAIQLENQSKTELLWKLLLPNTPHPPAEEAELPNLPDSPAEDIPAEDSPAEEAELPNLPDSPAEDSPAEDSPAEDSPAEDSPAEDIPAEDIPAEDSPAEEVETKSYEPPQAPPPPKTLQQSSLKLFGSPKPPAEEWHSLYKPDLVEVKMAEKLYTADKNLTVDEATTQTIDAYLVQARRKAGLPSVTTLSDFTRDMDEAYSVFTSGVQKVQFEDRGKWTKTEKAKRMAEAIAPGIRQMIDTRRGILMLTKIRYDTVDPDLYYNKYYGWYDLLQARIQEYGEKWTVDDYRYLGDLVGVDHIECIMMGCDMLDRWIIPNEIRGSYPDRFPQSDHLEQIRNMMLYAVHTKSRVGAIDATTYHENRQHSMPLPFFKALPLSEVVDLMVLDPYHAEPLIADLCPHPNWSSSEVSDGWWNKNPLLLIKEIKNGVPLYDEITITDTARFTANKIGLYLTREVIMMIRNNPNKTREERLRDMFMNSGSFYQLIRMCYAIAVCAHFTPWAEMYGDALKRRRGEYPQRHVCDEIEATCWYAWCDPISLTNNPRNSYEYYETKEGKKDLTHNFLQFLFDDWEKPTFRSDNGVSNKTVMMAKSMLRLVINVWPEDGLPETFLARLEEKLLSDKVMNPKTKTSKNRVHRILRKNFATLKELGM